MAMEYIGAAMGVSAIANAGLEVAIDYPNECKQIKDSLGLIDDANNWAEKLVKSINQDTIDIEDHTKRLDDIITRTQKMIVDRRVQQAKKSNKNQLMSLVICFTVSMLLMLKLMSHFNLI